MESIKIGIFVYFTVLELWFDLPETNREATLLSKARASAQTVEADFTLTSTSDIDLYFDGLEYYRNTKQSTE